MQNRHTDLFLQVSSIFSSTTVSHFLITKITNRFFFLYDLKRQRPIQTTFVQSASAVWSCSTAERRRKRVSARLLWLYNRISIYAVNKENRRYSTRHSRKPLPEEEVSSLIKERSLVHMCSRLRHRELTSHLLSHSIRQAPECAGRKWLPGSQVEHL